MVAAPLYQTHFKNQEDQNLIKLALHKNPFFSCLDEEQLERLVATAELKSWNTGDVVILEGCVDEEVDGPDQMDSNVERSQPKLPASSVDLLSSSAGDDTICTEEGDSTFSNFKDCVIVEESDGEKTVSINESGSSQDSAEAEASSYSENELVEPYNETIADDVVKHFSPETYISRVESIDAGSLENTPHDEPKIGRARVKMEAISIPKSPIRDRADEALVSTLDQPPPPSSGIIRRLYIVRKGNIGVWYQPHFNPANLGPGTLFGEGGFLFGRQHSASVIASEPVECWVVDISTFRNHVLPSENMKKIFHRYAHQTEEGEEPFMTMAEFTEAVAARQHEANPLSTTQDATASFRIANAYNILRHSNMRQTVDEARISMNDFCFFHLLMARPDPEVDVAFLLMDEKQSGQISLADLADFLRPVFPHLNFKTEFFHRYFGKDGNQRIRQTHFSQFLVDLQREMGQQAFMRALEEHGTQEGYIPRQDFVKILTTIGGKNLPKGIVERLEAVYCHECDQKHSNDVPDNVVSRPPKHIEHSSASLYFAYGDFLAFQEVLGKLPFICNLIEKAQEIKGGMISPDDFKIANQVLGLGSRLSRRQLEIVFGLFDLDRDGYVSKEDTVSVCGEDFARSLIPSNGRGDRLTFAPPPLRSVHEPKSAEKKPFFEHMLQKSALAGMAFLAGGFSVGLLCPLDIVKTRLMNQRIWPGGTNMYKGAMDCMKQTIRSEGVAGLFRGILPQLLGVVPERIIKLQVHHLLLQAFDPPDEIPSPDRKTVLWLESLAGGCAGACQLLVTNPMEVTKIRLQLQGETSRILQARGLAPPPTKSLIRVIRDLGLPGVFRGASACLLRDVPFSALYFPLYAVCKESRVRHNSDSRKVSPIDILLAGTIAAIPAAILTSPADVIKTRIQSVARSGETRYHGMVDCTTRIYKQEGIRAFFHGSTVRTLRLAPQFGLSLLAFEGFAGAFGLQGAMQPPTTVPIDPRDYSGAFPMMSGTFSSWFRSER